MCCLAEFLIKYTLIISNIIFSFTGLAIAGLGIAAHIQLNQITELIPVNLSALSISIIVLGCVVFMIAYLACCGAMRESRWMLYSYCVFMAILAAIKIYITVVMFNFLETAVDTVHRWIYNAFSNQDLRPAYNVMEELFRCCGTTGSDSYQGVIPGSCCGNTDNAPCTNNNDVYDGCFDIVTGWFQTFGGAIGAVLIVIIIVEVVCIIFGLHVSNTIRNKNRR